MTSAVQVSPSSLGDGQAAAVDGDRVAQAGVRRARCGARTVRRSASPWSSTAGDGAELLDDSGEHQCSPFVGVRVSRDVGLLAVRSRRSSTVTSVTRAAARRRWWRCRGRRRRSARRRAASARRRRPPRRPAPPARNAAARVGPPSRNTCCGRARTASASTVVRVAGAQVDASRRASSKTRRSGSRSRSPITTRSGWRGQRLVVARRARSAAGRRPRPCWCRPASRRTARAAGGCRGARPRAGDPAAGAVGGGAAAVEGGGELPGHERPAVLDREGPHPVQRPGLVGQQPAARPRCRPRAAARAPPAATGFGSAWANTTRRTPASTQRAARTGRCGRCGCTARG